MAEQADRPQSATPEDEIAHLRERLAFYESFDKVIHDNVSHSSDLLRRAAESQQAAHRALAEANANAAAARAADQTRFRELFSTLLDEVTTLQGQLERLARRVADTLDDLESESAPTPPARTAAPQPEPSESAAAPSTQTHEEDEQPVAPEEPFEEFNVAPGVTSEDLDASEPYDEAPEGVQPFSVEQSNMGGGTAAPAEPAMAASETAPAGDVAADEPQPLGGATILVHGVPRATTALSLKRFLENLPEVDHVEPREYAEGVLRLLVVGTRPVSLSDLQSWPDGAKLEPVNVRADLLEVRLS
jgi:hypothetical protein